MSIDSKTRAVAIYLSRVQGLSVRKVAKACNISKSTVWRICNMQKTNEGLRRTTRERRGRPKKLKPRQERQLRRSIHILREEEGSFTIKRLMQHSCISRGEMSEITVYRFLNREGYYFLQARKKGLLTKKDLKHRRVFAKRMLKTFAEDVWTKDIAFYLDGTGFAYKRNPLDQARAPKARIWRKKCEGLTVGCTAKGKKTGTGGRVLKLIVAISYNKGVVCCTPYDKMNGKYFAKFIEDNFETMFAVADKGERRLWLQDGDPSQNSAIAKAAMVRVKCEVMKIPARSPDLNPIENFFHLVSRSLKEQAITLGIERETYEQFRHRVIQTITSVPLETINNIIASMKNRVRDVIKRKGQRLKY